MIKLRLIICLGVILHMWVVLYHFSTLASPIARIRTYHALTLLQTDTLTTQLSITLGITILALLGYRIIPFGISVHGRSRIT